MDTNSGERYSKERIERDFSLADKFKILLKDILNTPDPTREKWWNSFCTLEYLRDEIIHSKQSKSEERYSRFLSHDIFEKIKSHVDIIKYYGYFIFQNKKDLLNEYPYNFEYDSSSLILIDENQYEKEFQRLYNPVDSKKKK